MTLKAIDTRLSLFKDYMVYWTDNWQSLPCGRLYTFRTVGMMYCYQVMSFDQWLYVNGHEDLVLFNM